MIDVAFGGLRGVGAKTGYILEYAVGVARLAGAAARRAVRRPLRLGEVAYQIEVIGITSLSIVILTAVFSSMVMTVQFAP